MRPRPVLYLAAFLAALDAFAGAGAALDFLPRSVVATVVLANVVFGAAGAVLVQGAVTPLSAPQDATGARLVPVAALAPQVTAAARQGAQQAVIDASAMKASAARPADPRGTLRT